MIFLTALGLVVVLPTNMLLQKWVSDSEKPSFLLKKLAHLTNKYFNMTFFNQQIFLFQDAYLEMVFVSVLFLQQVIFSLSFQGDQNPNWVVVSSWVMLAVSLAGALIALIVLLAARRELVKMARNIGAYYEGLNGEHPLIVLSAMIFYVKRLLYSAVLLFMPDYPAMQLGACIVLSMAYLLYQFTQKPVEESQEQFMEMFNEIGVLLVTASALGFTDAFEDLAQKNAAGDFACVIVFAIIAGNLASLFYTNFKALRAYFRKTAVLRQRQKAR